MGREVTFASSSHERSHIFMAAGMSEHAPLRECVVLVWEGGIGAFYSWRDFGAVLERVHVMRAPGARYSALFAIADPSFPDSGWTVRTDFAGKLMAIAGLNPGDSEPTPEERLLVQELFAAEDFYPFDKARFRTFACYNVGPCDPSVARAARLLTDRIFARFRDVAAERMPRDVPLVLAGGCALNCEWNRRWEDSGLFTSVEAFPCGDDSGSAIGTAIDVSTALGGMPSLEWSVYSGPAFVHDADMTAQPRWARRELDFEHVAKRLMNGAVVALVNGRAEIGPRALGHRSLLASPMDPASHSKLNAIKRRESYRPVAPCCLVEEQGRWFDRVRPDPYMLFFSRVLTSELPSVTHTDGTARVQSVSEDGPDVLRRLLEAFAQVSGVGVLCNTSLNFHGLGFINRMTDLIDYARETGLTDLIVDGEYLSTA
jgi:hydroxymethyl cephem carbamoyltransferase